MTSIQPNSSVGMQPAAPQAQTRAVEAASEVAVSTQVSAATPSRTAEPKAKPDRPAEPLVDFKQMRREVEAAIERLNEQVAQNSRALGFSVDEETDRLIVRVTNKETGELVRQIPAEAVIRFAHSMEDLRGILFDEEL